jgi:ParB-like chromosome segregation protein Spo0J
LTLTRKSLNLRSVRGKSSQGSKQMKFENHPQTQKRSGGWAAPSLLRLNPQNDRQDFGDFPLEWAQKVCDPSYELTDEDKAAIEDLLSKSNPDDDKTMAWLVNSVSIFGVQDPLRGFWDGDEETFTVTAGNRRTTAVNIAVKVRGVNIEKVPTDLEKGNNPLDFVFRQWIENSGKKEFTAIEKAHNIQRMINMGASASDLPGILGISPAGMRSLLDLLVLLPEAQELVRNGEVSPSAAIEITRRAKQESSNPVAASTRATEKVLTLAKKAKESGAKHWLRRSIAMSKPFKLRGMKNLSLRLSKRGK